jgi:hypothetical protein
MRRLVTGGGEMRVYSRVVGDLRRFGALLREWRERHRAAEQQHTGDLTGARRTPGLRREEVAERSGFPR